MRTAVPNRGVQEGLRPRPGPGRPAPRAPRCLPPPPREPASRQRPGSPGAGYGAPAGGSRLDGGARTARTSARHLSVPTCASGLPAAGPAETAGGWARRACADTGVGSQSGQPGAAGRAPRAVFAYHPRSPLPRPPVCRTPSPRTQQASMHPAMGRAGAATRNAAPEASPTTGPPFRRHRPPATGRPTGAALVNTESPGAEGRPPPGHGGPDTGHAERRARAFVHRPRFLHRALRPPACRAPCPHRRRRASGPSGRAAGQPGPCAGPRTAPRPAASAPAGFRGGPAAGAGTVVVLGPPEGRVPGGGFRRRRRIRSGRTPPVLPHAPFSCGSCGAMMCTAVRIDHGAGPQSIVWEGRPE